MFKKLKTGAQAGIILHMNSNHVVCFIQKGIPHGWDYFRPQQKILHTKHFHKSCFDTSNTW